MGGGAWPFLVGGAICLVNSDNERDSVLLTSSGAPVAGRVRVPVAVVPPSRGGGGGGSGPPRGAPESLLRGTGGV